MRLTYNTHRHQEQSFTSNRNKSLSMFLLKEMITRVRSFYIFGVKGKWRKTKYSPIVSSKNIDGIPVCHHSVFAAPARNRTPYTHIFLQLKTKYLVKDGVKRVNKYCTLHPQTHHMVAASSSGGQSQKARSWVSNTQHCQSSCGQNQHWEQL